MTQTTAKSRRKRRTGRRPGDSGTRDAILDAARDLFAENGYEATSIRAIAKKAGVDPALVRHFFVDKETLFAAVIGDRTIISESLKDALTGDPGTVSERFTDTYLRLWEDPDTRPILMSMFRSAATSQRQSDKLREMLSSRIWPTASEAQILRLTIAGAHLLGIAIARHIVEVPALAALDHETLVSQVAPTIDQCLRTDQQSQLGG